MPFRGPVPVLVIVMLPVALAFGAAFSLSFFGFTEMRPPPGVAVAVGVGVGVAVAVVVVVAVGVAVAEPVDVAVAVGGGIALGQAFAKLYASTVPIPVAKSQPVVAGYVGWYTLVEVESTPISGVPNTPDNPSAKQSGSPIMQGSSMSPWVTSWNMHELATPLPSVALQEESPPAPYSLRARK